MKVCSFHDKLQHQETVSYTLCEQMVPLSHTY